MLIRIQNGKLVLKRPQGDEKEGYKARASIITHFAKNDLHYFGLRLNTQIAKIIESTLGNCFDVHLEVANKEVLVVYTPTRKNM